MLESKYIQLRDLGSLWYGHCHRLLVQEADYRQAYAIASDLACSFLPAVVLWNVKIDIRLKIAVSALMSLGLMYACPRSCILDFWLICRTMAMACVTVKASATAFTQDLTCESQFNPSCPYL